MNNKIKSEKYRKLSIAALVTGILADGLAGLYMVFWLPFSNFLRSSIGDRAPAYIIIFILGLFMPVVLGLSITAVLCGSIDLKRVKADSCSNKGKGFDIAGIVLGGIFILFALVFLLGEIIVPH